MKRCGYFILAVLLLAVVMASGCGGENKKELIVLCGSSFVQPSEEFIEIFKKETGVSVVTSTAGSEDFLPLVKVGKKGDILITHDPYLDYVYEAGALLDYTEVGFLEPVLAVAPGNPKGIHSIEDLAKDGLKVGLTDPQYSTCGEMVYDLLKAKGIKEAVLRNVGNRLTKGHNNLGTLMQTGAVDAVIMWNGVAHNYRQYLEIVKTPYEYNTLIRVHFIGLNYTRNPDLVRRFISLAKERAADIFASYGYVK